MGLIVRRSGLRRPHVCYGLEVCRRHGRLPDPTGKLHLPQVRIIQIQFFRMTSIIMALIFMDRNRNIILISNSFLIFLYYFLMCFRKPEANWGSSADAQTFITAMKSTQDLTDSPDHIKTYRPKILVLTGSPAHRYRSLYDNALFVIIFRSISRRGLESKID